MRTKFILHGGNAKVDRDDMNDSFWKEISSDAREGDSVLFIYFAGIAEDWPELYEQNKSEFLKNSPTKDLSFDIAEEEKFIEQIKKANFIYLRGGNTSQLFDTLKKYPDFSKLIKGKTIIGSSAGAYVLCKYFYTHSEDKVLEGLGVLPFRIICHYDGSEEEKFQGIGEDYELIKLKDFEYKVFNIDI